MFKEINKEKVLEQVFLKPTEEHSIRELARLAGISPATASKICAQLQKERIVAARTIAKSKLISADLESKEYRFQKTIYNMKSLKPLLDVLSKGKPKAVALFGSYARGEDTEDSDIDIAVIGTEQEIDKESIEKMLGRRLHMMFFSSESDVPAAVMQSIRNGKILEGSLL